MRKEIIFSILKFCLIYNVSTISAQNYVDELAIMGGGTYYLGELNPYTHFNNYNYTIGGIYRRSLRNKRIVLRTHLIYGVVSAKSTTNDLSFRSSILEFGPLVEINYLPFEIGDKKKYKGTPYLFIGINFFKMNPQTNFNGRWVNLQSLGTEGQGSSLNNNKQYKSQQLTFPLGVGVKINLSKRFALNLEYGIRKTFTDYLDDVSGTYVDSELLKLENGELSAEISKSYGVEGLQRGNSQNKDWYAIYGIMLSYRILAKNECRNNFMNTKKR